MYVCVHKYVCVHLYVCVHMCVCAYICVCFCAYVTGKSDEVVVEGGLEVLECERVLQSVHVVLRHRHVLVRGA